MANDLAERPEPPKTLPPAESEDQIIDQIARESVVTDEQIDKESDPIAPTIITGQKEHHRLRRFLLSRKLWLPLLFILVISVIFTWLITPSRAWLLNTLGFRATLTIGTTVATPQGTPPTLKNVTVKVNGQTYYTDAHGNARIATTYGDKHIVVSKQGYDTQTKDVTLDFDPFFYYFGGKQADRVMNTLDFSLKNVGIPIAFTVKDWLSGLPITFGTFAIGDVSAQPDAHGNVSLAIPATDAKKVQMSAVFGKNYTDTTFDFALDKTTGQQLTFVPAGKDYFISKRSGQLAVYSANVDGSAVTQVIPGSPNETGDMAFSASPSGKYGVLASTRDGTRDNFNSIQQRLYLVDLTTNTLTPLDTALRFQFADWSGDTLVYTADVHDGSGATVQRLASLDAPRAQLANLASASVFSVVRLSLGNAVYLTGTKDLKTIKVKGGIEKTLGTNVQQLTQTDTAVFAFQLGDSSWHQYNANADQVAGAATPSSTNRAFLGYTSADGQTELVVDIVDGKPTLIAKKVAGGHESELFTDANLHGPIRWAGNTAVYSVGSADYAISPDGGSAHKITDITAAQTSNNDYFNLN